MTPRGSDLVFHALGFLGQPYSTLPGRTSPTSGHKDCSGLVAAAYELTTGEELGVYVTVTIFDRARREGLVIPREDALGIPGSCLLMPDNPILGWGPLGHIGFATGDGHTVEATPPRVQRLPVGYQPWGPLACLLPGIDYGQHVPEWSEDDMTPEQAAQLNRVEALLLDLEPKINTLSHNYVADTEHGTVAVINETGDGVRRLVERFDK